MAPRPACGTRCITPGTTLSTNVTHRSSSRLLDRGKSYAEAVRSWYTKPCTNSVGVGQIFLRAVFVASSGFLSTRLATPRISRC